MGLYLCVFDADEEVDGVEVGSYADFNALRDFVTLELERRLPGSRFPVLILHSDCDGEWSVEDCEKLQLELGEIASELEKRPPINFAVGWQTSVAKSVGLVPRNAFECFIDVDGEMLINRLSRLVSVALRHRLPILFQ